MQLRISADGRHFLQGGKPFFWLGDTAWLLFSKLTYEEALTPIKPVLDGEPSYELIPQGLHDPSQPYWQAHDVRRYAYWSLLAGACGFTYGSNAIMQFWRGDETGSYGPVETWQQALHDAGSFQMCHVRHLMEEIRVNTAMLGASIRGCWFDPVSGVRSPFGAVPSAPCVAFTPPDRRDGRNDWILLLETE